MPSLPPFTVERLVTLPLWIMCVFSVVALFALWWCALSLWWCKYGFLNLLSADWWCSLVLEKFSTIAFLTMPLPSSLRWQRFIESFHQVLQVFSPSLFSTSFPPSLITSLSHVPSLTLCAAFWYMSVLYWIQIYLSVFLRQVCFICGLPFSVLVFFTLGIQFVL